MNTTCTQRKLRLTATLAILVLGISSHASAIALFTVDPNGAFGATGGPHPGSFQANFITGNSSTLVTKNVDLIHQSGHGWVNFSAFVDNGSNVLGPVSGLNNDWQMWAEFSYTLSLTSGAYAATNSTYNVDTLHVNFYADPSIATATTFTPATAGGVDATVTHGADSFQFANADLLVGVANINSLGGTGFNSTNTFALLNPQGTSLFTAPAPFYNFQFDEFNNTSQGVTSSATHLAINQTSGGIDFQPIPEPATLALLGIGLLGVGAARRKYRTNVT